MNDKTVLETAYAAYVAHLFAVYCAEASAGSHQAKEYFVTGVRTAQMCLTEAILALTKTKE